MSNCANCGVEALCHYPYKPCDCVLQRKFMSAEERAEFDHKEEERTPHPRDVEWDKAGMLGEA